MQQQFIFFVVAWVLMLTYYLLLQYYDQRQRPRRMDFPAGIDWSLWAQLYEQLYLPLLGRVRRFWRYCRRHFGFGIGILDL